MEHYYEEYLGILLEEAEKRLDEFSEPLQTVYIGGGTPSLLPPSLFGSLIRNLRKRISFDQVIEFTAEANPGTVTKQWLDIAAESGVNRISFGMQAGQNELLNALGRIHCFEDVLHSVELARSSGISNISLDLIFGIPAQSKEQWTETLEAALSIEPQHISAYGLIPEEGTPLFDDIEHHRLFLPEPEEEREMYDIALKMLNVHGLRQYEISNFSKPGYESIHNIGYWTQIPYVGLGASAASMTGMCRKKEGMSYIRKNNPPGLADYQEAVAGNSGLIETEFITPDMARYETIMLGLRMNRGINPEHFEEMHGKSLDECYGMKLKKLKEKGLLAFGNSSWKLTRRGMDIQNAVLVELMDD